MSNTLERRIAWLLLLATLATLILPRELGAGTLGAVGLVFLTLIGLRAGIKPGVLRWACAGVGVGCLVHGGGLINVADMAPGLRWAWAGLVGVILALALQSDEADETDEAAPPTSTGRDVLRAGLMRRTTQLGILALIAVTLWPDMHYGVQTAGLLGGIGLVVLGMGGGWQVWRRQFTVTLTPRLTLELSVLVVILGLAALVRLNQLDTAIPRLIDEIISVQAVNQLSREPATNILTPYGLIARFSWLFIVLQKGVIDLTGPDLAGIRMISVIFGTLTVALTWWTSRVLFRQPFIPLLAALALATFPAHIHFSRIGLNNIADPLFFLLAVGLLALALNTTRPAGAFRYVPEQGGWWRLNTPTLPYFALAGASLGLTHYFYEGGRLLYAPVFALWLGIWLWRARRGRIPRPEGGLRVLLVVFVIVIGPYYWTTITASEQVAPRLETESRLPEDLLTDYDQQLAGPVHALLARPDESEFYGGATGIIPPAWVPLVLMGVGVALWRGRSLPGSLLVVWLAGFILGISLLIEQADAPRYVVILPALAMLAAWGAYAVARLLVAWPAAVLICVIAFVPLAEDNVRYYFQTHIPDYMATYGPATARDMAIQQAAQVPPHTDIYVVSNFPFFYDHLRRYLYFVRGGEDPTTLIYAQTPGETEMSALLTPDQSKNQLYVIAPYNPEFLARLTREIGPPDYTMPSMDPYHQYAFFYLENPDAGQPPP
jgi:hypothetical protein